jgi:hypothetical protein
MRSTLIAAVLGALSAALFGAVAARAQIPADVAARVGEVSVEVQCPQSGYIADRDAAKQVGSQRSVRVTISNPGTAYQNPYVQMTLLYAGEVAVLNQCPVTTAIPGVYIGASNVQDIGSFQLYGAPADGAPVRLLLQAGPYNTFMVHWDNIVDVYAQEQQDAAATQAAQQQAAASAEQATEQAQQQAQWQAAAAAREQATDIWWGNLWHTIKMLFWLAVFGSIAVWLYNRRYPIARWYYFTFHPHPAEPAIRSALASGTVLDGHALASILGETPPGYGILRQVRAAQAQSLIQEMQEMTRARMRELEERAKADYQRAAVQQMQAALAESAVALEKAKAFIRASAGDPNYG